MPTPRRAVLIATAGAAALLTGLTLPAQSSTIFMSAPISQFAGGSSSARTPNYANWYSKSITSEHFGAPTVGDFDRDGLPDIIAGFPDGSLHAWHATNGVQFFSAQVGAGAIQGSPTLVDINGDGAPEILVADTAGDVMAFKKDGHLAFKAKTGDGHHQPGDFAAPVAVDLNKDGRMDVVESSWDHHLHAWDGTTFGLAAPHELPGFPVFLADTSWSSPAIADLDHDGWNEIIFGYDCDGVQGQPCYPSPGPGGYLAVIRHDGTRQQGFPKFIPGQVVWSSPAVTDLDGDGKLDIVVGTGLEPAPHMPGGQYVYAFHHNGTTFGNWPAHLGGRVFGSPAVGDLDGDGKKDVAVVAEDSKMYMLNRYGSVMHTTCIDDAHNCAVHGLHSSPSIADVDGDGRQDVVVTGEHHVWVIDSANPSALLTYYGASNGFTLPMNAAPAIAQISGKTWIIESTSEYESAADHTHTHGRIFAWTPGVGSATTPSWPTFHQSPNHYGLL